MAVSDSNYFWDILEWLLVKNSCEDLFISKVDPVSIFLHFIVDYVKEFFSKCLSEK